MGNLVIDSSVWIDFFNKKTAPKIETVKSLIIAETVVSTITLLPVIIQEILQGIRNNKHYDVVKESLAGFNHLVYDSYDFAISAADLYRFLQRKGLP
jgi:predicted nucleic acid-binding protein